MLPLGRGGKGEFLFPDFYVQHIKLNALKLEDWMLTCKCDRRQRVPEE